MKKKSFYLFAMMMAVVLCVGFTSCSSDDEEEVVISKSDLIGTWYTLEYDFVYVFSETSMTQYELLAGWTKSRMKSL